MSAPFHFAFAAFAGALLAASGCKSDRTRSHHDSEAATNTTGSGGATSAATDTGTDTTGAATSGGAGQAGAPGAPSTWSCGSAAGVCTCTVVEGNIQRQNCPASDCCFRDPTGDCTCRLAAPAPECEALMASFDATEPVPTCPPGTDAP